MSVKPLKICNNIFFKKKQLFSSKILQFFWELSGKWPRNEREKHLGTKDLHEKPWSS